MIKRVLKKIFGTQFDREVKKIQPVVDEINRIYAELSSLSEEELKHKTVEFKEKIQDCIDKKQQLVDELELRYDETSDDNEKDKIGFQIDDAKKDLDEETKNVLEEILPEAFAVIKETCRRLVGTSWSVRGREIKWNMIPYDVQLIGAIALHRGMVTEMKTGEGKTLAATMPLYLNALVGKGSHLITVNDYLAQRDAEWMGQIYKYHGLTVGCIYGEQEPSVRREQYAADITYGTNNEFGFDYLRDNMAISPEGIVQRGHYYCIVDEADSVLIDEARTPLIISGTVEHSKNYFRELNPQIRKLVIKQQRLVNEILSEINTMIENGTVQENEFEFGKKMLTVKRAAPKSKRFLKLLKDGHYQKIMNEIEGQYLREKQIHKLDEQLYYSIDEGQHSADLNEMGQDELSKYDSSLFVMPDLDEEIEKINNNETLDPAKKQAEKQKVQEEFLEKNEKLHNIKQMLLAYSLFEKDVEYIVTDNRVVIVDQFTGRIMPGRRFSEGLHQALESKENVQIQKATQTLATITLQNYFRMYTKLAGMTGTAITEQVEFEEIYKLPVIEIPTNEPIRRIDYDDLIYRTKKEKYEAITDEIEEMYQQRRPVLVGTISVEVSEIISRLLKRKNIPHEVLNAKYHEKEAEIVEYAGLPGAVTIATNMAGRGTDIKLGKEVVRCDTCVVECVDDFENAGNNKPSPDHNCKEKMPCGLHIIGTERHESRRIDRQLRGRSGRQGDPGSSKFFLSLEDDLMRIFGSDRIAGLMSRMGLEEGDAIKHPWMTKAVENAQKKVEGHNFEIRKQLIKYDDVMNQQREVIYSYRRKVLRGLNLRDEVLEMLYDTINNKVSSFIGSTEYEENWPLEDIIGWFENELGVKLDISLELGSIKNQEDLVDTLYDHLTKAYSKKEKHFEDEQRKLERYSLLKVVDEQWKDHLYEMDRLKEGIGLRAYGQRDPLIEYKKESFELFLNLIDTIKEKVIKNVFTLYPALYYQVQDRVKDMQLSHKERNAFDHVASRAEGQRERIQNIPQGQHQPQQQPEESKRQPMRREEEKVGRNDPCPCGSGKKYKHCCGQKG
ncbi:MAG TPA: preprotein translocase subunit SecA [Candidatus Cloacimonetes bacterium]|nr:preprotein translocase subunit SecA [Candidatus Cloacimonadota bacterium]